MSRQRTHVTVNVEMLRDGFSYSDAAVYSRLWWLARYHDNEELLHPSISQMCNDLHLSKRQVIYSLQNLEDSGLITTYHRGYKRRNNYEVISLDLYPCEVGY